MELSDYSFSIKLVDVIRTIVRSEMDKRHKVRIAEVVSIDRVAMTCFVKFVESPDTSVKVSMSAIQPGSVGQKVRVESIDNDWLITHVLGGGAYALQEVSAPYTEAAVTLSLEDAGKLLYYSNASLVTVTIPTNASVPFATGTRVTLMSTGAGGLTLNTSNVALFAAAQPLVTVASGEALHLEKYATNTWSVIGGTS